MLPVRARSGCDVLDLLKDLQRRIGHPLLNLYYVGGSLPLGEMAGAVDFFLTKVRPGGPLLMNMGMDMH